MFHLTQFCLYLLMWCVPMNIENLFLQIYKYSPVAEWFDQGNQVVKLKFGTRGGISYPD